MRHIRLIVGILCCAIGVAASGCGYSKLVIQNENVVSWMTVNNEFARLDTASWRDSWRGVLFQLGTFPSTDVYFQSVEFYDDETLIYEVTSGDFSWINVVSGGAIEDPMGPEHAPLLYPSYADDPCDAVTDALRLAIGDSDCDTSDLEAAVADGLDTNACFRLKRFHSGQSPNAILTYWAGPSGYIMTDDQEEGPSGGASRVQVFHLKDKAVIRVYEEIEAGGIWRMKEVSGVPDLSTVTEIRIVDGTSGPADGTKIDPGWGGG